MAKFDGTNWTAYDISNSDLPGNFIKSIAIDSQGNKWIGTDNDGLAKFDSTNWTVYKALNSGLTSDVILSITIDDYGNKWIGTYGICVFNENGVVSVKENHQIRNNITIYPNPARDHLNIEPLRKNEISSIDIFSIQGKLIESKKTNNTQQSIDISDLSGGGYILKIHTENGLRMKKFIKQ